MSNQKKKKANPRVIVLILTILVCLLAAGCFVGNQYIRQQADALLKARQEEVAAINAQRQQEYMVALSEFQKQTSSGANLAWPAQKTTGWDVVELDNYPLENPSYTMVDRYDVLYGGMLLVNEWHSRPDDFDESGIQSVTTYSKHKIGVRNSSVRAFPIAIDAWLEAVAAAKEQGYENYVVWEGYRTWDEQNDLFQNAMSKYANSYSGDDLIARAKKDVNYPGTSEFNTGLTLTVRLYKNGDAEVNNKVFFQSDEGLWFLNNAWRYGLVFRFPMTDYPVKGTADKSYKTGVRNDSLRAFRYVGKGNAAVMHTLDLCLEEYIEYLMQHPHIAVFEDGALKYEIIREYVGDASSFPISIVGSAGIRNYTTSLDNMGYAITVFEY